MKHNILSAINDVEHYFWILSQCLPSLCPLFAKTGDLYTHSIFIMLKDFLLTTGDRL